MSDGPDQHALTVEGRLTQQIHREDHEKPIGVDAIDQIGVSHIAERLEISPQAVRRWRQKGKIPDDRLEDLRALLSDCLDQVSVAAQVAEVSDMVDVVSDGPKRATSTAPERGRREKPFQALTVAPSDRPTMNDISGRHAQSTMDLLIAAREVDQARVVVDKAAAEADGLPPVSPVRGYRLRLAVLFALDFPILTMAFASVTEASPIVAAGSAVALSLGLVLCAHAAGARLRSLAGHIPAWLCDLTALVIMVALIAAVLGVATELRLKGFELDETLLARAGAGIFGDDPGTSAGLPDSFTWAIVRAAGLVTVLLTVFGISWSYQNHGPQRAFASAEKTYRSALRRYAHAVRKSSKASLTGPALAALAMVSMTPISPTQAADCHGPSVLAFIDTTTSYDDQDRQQIMPAIDDMMTSLVPGSRLVIRTVRDAPSSSRLLLEECVPEVTTFEWNIQGAWAWLTTNPAAARTAQASFRQSISDALLPELRQHGDAPGTALIDTIRHFTDETELSAVWIFSDLLESVATSTASLLTSSASLVRAGHTGLTLPGVKVHAAGVGRFHDQNRRQLTSSERGSLVDSWAAVIRQSGGELHLIE